jgi:hypothetical protein
MLRLFALALALSILSACSSSDEAGGEDTGGSDSYFAPDFGGFGSDTGSTEAGGTDETDGGSQGDGDTGDTEATGGDDAAGDAGDGGGFDYPCEPGAIEQCETACGSIGKKKCLKDWGPCVPLDELCGTCLDEDCDGLTDEDCPPDPSCTPVEPECPTAVLSIAEGTEVGTGALLHLSAKQSVAPDSTVAKWSWSVQAPPGSTSDFAPSADVQEPTFLIDVAGTYLFSLEVFDLQQTPSCSVAQVAVVADPFPPAEPEPGCADGTREGFVDQSEFPQVAACAGAWSVPGITPASVAPTCNRQGGDDGPNPEGSGCSSADLCAEGWHVCDGWQDLAQKSPSGCAGATPPDAKPKSLFFALRQACTNDIVCDAALAGSNDNDVFGCGNLGVAIGDDKGCGPLDRALASTQPDTCGFNEAMPPLGPWECKGGANSDLHEGANVTKKGCPGTSCSYDGAPIGSGDKGGVLCCRD